MSAKTLGVSYTVDECKAFAHLMSSLSSLPGLLKVCQSGKRRRPLVYSATFATASTSTTQRTVPLRPRALTPCLTPHITATRPMRGPTATSARPSDTRRSPVMMIRPSKAPKTLNLHFNSFFFLFPVNTTHLLLSHYISHNSLNPLQMFPYCIFILYLCISLLATVLI